ncbi:DUF2294 domain-containing protein [Aneurinibacillus uraniidurans]|uniref:DUF2294 domain-containing protein n=1 Tax=Aneurinibacillus uraniidurans TaxID=2966586 RepID=UPI00234B1A67|nr:DUF2294 domain-containing protein [Aneurinibacillus sp. B1]WCN38372.1 DUF2294 domain-containing protein [Aneurinibacillus sp. B1]
MGQVVKSHMESTISEAYIKFLRGILGRGPKETKTYIIRDMVIVRLKDVLTQEEKALAHTERGRPLVKQMRRILRETHSVQTEEIISTITGCQVISSHSDISTKLGEQVEMFILDCDLEKKCKVKME